MPLWRPNSSTTVGTAVPERRRSLLTLNVGVRAPKVDISAAGFRRGAAAANRLQMQEPPHPATQDAVFELLGNPATYRLPATAQIARHQTHAAIVFLAGDCALKVKRAVRYPFLDFSMLHNFIGASFRSHATE